MKKIKRRRPHYLNVTFDKTIYYSDDNVPYVTEIKRINNGAKWPKCNCGGNRK